MNCRATLSALTPAPRLITAPALIALSLYPNLPFFPCDPFGKKYNSGFSHKMRRDKDLIMIVSDLMRPITGIINGQSCMCARKV